MISLSSPAPTGVVAEASGFKYMSLKTAGVMIPGYIEGMGETASEGKDGEKIRVVSLKILSKEIWSSMTKREAVRTCFA